ncbi:hypothetical protein Poli38472_004316 [Pythium oligandrum]|uniref:CCT domain-containing protein n=1 Tax=Pythium oligandrum TaxID=41045 RepID=A0A8K1CPW7_PYTOL|nr:hypothetical protein Poli38472_004316 [Pythium oligandrum]|eukprot:TMW66551.1 hypothetical protein Poli38472_004316 [Pythium oligandrum]
MLDNEVAETLMSLSAPDERKLASNPLYSNDGLPWHANKKRSFNSFNVSASGSMANSLPNTSFLQDRAGDFAAFSMLQRNIRERPLTSMIPSKYQDDDDDDESDVDMSNNEDSDDSDEHDSWNQFRSPFDGLVAAAASNQFDNDKFSLSSSSRPISIPSRRVASGFGPGLPLSRSLDSSRNHKWSLSRVKEDASFIGRDCSPTGIEDDREWFDSFRQTDEYRQRARLASICSSEGSTSEYGGLGRKHLEEFIRMEISAANENDSGNQMLSCSPQDGETKYIGSYSPEARRKRIERFLEKRKRRVWSKKVDYDVRKNFANSRLRVKGRFVKKEDEELLCQLLSFT